MKTVLTLLAFTVALNFNGFAQQSGTAEPQKRTPEEIQTMVAKRQTEQLVKQLNLDAKQEKSVGEVNHKYAVLRAKVIESSKQEKNVNVRSEMLELNEKRENEILKLLNAEQTATYNTAREERERRREQLREEAEKRRQENSQN